MHKSIIVRLLVLGVCGYMVVTLASLWNDYGDSKAELAQLKQQLAAEKNDIDQLKGLLEKGTDEEIIEEAARRRLGYVYSDEQVFVDISGN